MSEFIQISFTDLQPEQKDILIAQLSDAGFEGFEELDNDLDAYIKKAEYKKLLLNEIVSNQSLSYTETVIENINWNQLWESNFQPIKIDNFAGIRADFHAAITGIQHEIIITPKMSFGTGHHPTTYMMIEQMREIEFTGKSVFDFGTGTGILAILAEKLGAGKIFAADIDDWSIENAKENIKRNHCSKIQIEKSVDAGSGNKYDIILANINKNVIIENLSALKEQLSKNGILVISGILEEDKPEILSAVSTHGLQLKKELVKTKWVCIKFAG